MAKARFMTMRWLREHLKEIIWTTIILFVLSIFIIGYGTSRAAKQHEERTREAEEALAKDQAAKREEEIPENLRDKMLLPAVHISLPHETASVTKILDVKTVFESLMELNEYRQMLNMPAQIRQAFGAQLKEKVISSLVDKTLVELFATACKIHPPMTAAGIVANDRQILTQKEFDRKLQKSGLTLEEYGATRYMEETIRAVFVKESTPMASQAANDDELRKYYEENKVRFLKDDEISLKHLLIAPSDFAGQDDSDMELEIKDYYDRHLDEFQSGPRAEAFHIFIDPMRPEYLAEVSVDEEAIRMFYAENLDRYKLEEEVSARHILIKPANVFDAEFEKYSLNLRKFQLQPIEATDNKTDAGNTKLLYSFNAGIASQGSDMLLEYGDISVVGEDGGVFSPSEESQKLVSRPLELPHVGKTHDMTQGAIGIIVPATFTPLELRIKDGKAEKTFSVKYAHDEEKAFDAAESEAHAILDRIKKGESFATLAREYSQDDSNKLLGGDLGFFKRDKMVKPFSDAAFSATVGQPTGPVRTRFGQHLILVENKKPASTKPLEEVRASIVKEIRENRAKTKAITDLNNARELIQNHVQTFKSMVAKFSMGITKEQNGKLPIFFKGPVSDDYVQPQQKILFAEIAADGAIIPAIEDAVFALKPGELTEVIVTEKGCHLLMLESFKDPIPLKLTTPLKLKIKEQLEREKSLSAAREKAGEIATKITVDNFDDIATELKGTAEPEIESMPFKQNPGFSSYALATAMGRLTTNGFSYLPQIHKAIAEELYKAEAGGNKEFGNKVIGPLETELGFHFLVLLDAKLNQSEPFEEVKDDLRRMLVQTPSDEDILKEFEKNKESFAQPAQRKLRQIIVNDRELAEDIHKRLESGEIFALLAQRYSIDGSSQMGGEIGYLRRGQLPEELDKLVWELKKGEFTKPVETGFGWVIIMLDGDEIPHKDAELTDDIRRKIRDSIKEQNKWKLFASFLQGLRNKAFVVRHNDVLAEL